MKSIGLLVLAIMLFGCATDASRGGYKDLDSMLRPGVKPLPDAS